MTMWTHVFQKQYYYLHVYIMVIDAPVYTERIRPIYLHKHFDVIDYTLIHFVVG